MSGVLTCREENRGEHLSALYDQVAALDKGIADRWKAQTHDNPHHKLTAADVNVIVSPLLKGMAAAKKDRVFITEKQAEAIVTLVQATDFAPGGLDRLRFWVQFAEDSIALDMKPLVTSDQLSPIHNVLAVGSKFSFTSPGTHIVYAPHHYLGISKLIKDNKISVFEVDISELWKLTKDSGLYMSDSNMFFVYEQLSNPAATSTIVHEATHAIQDWLDVVSQRRFAEADAYIAGSATMTEPMLEGDLAAAAFAASRLVITGKATPANKDWQKAYDQTVKAYDAGHSDGRELMNNATKGETESAQFKVIIDAIDQQAEEFKDWVLDTANGAIRNVTGAINQAIP